MGFHENAQPEGFSLDVYAAHMHIYKYSISVYQYPVCLFLPMETFQQGPSVLEYETSFNCCFL